MTNMPGLPDRPKAEILIVADHPLVRLGMAVLLNNHDDLDVCCEAENAEQALSAIGSCSHALAIMDLSLPQAAGFELIETLTQGYRCVPVLVVSMHSTPGHVERALRAGARGYVSKQKATAMLVVAAREVLQGGIFVSAETQPPTIGRSPREEDSPARSRRLSQREWEVVALIGCGLVPPRSPGASIAASKPSKVIVLPSRPSSVS